MAPGGSDELTAALKEVEHLLQFPGVPGHYQRASELLVDIACGAPSAEIAELAMQAVARAYRCRGANALDPDLRDELHRLAEALRNP